MISPDDFKTGQWLLINQVRDEPSVEGMNGPFVMVQRSHPHGTPLKLLSVDLPWLLVWNGRDICPIDARSFSFQKASAKYVTAYLRFTGGQRRPPTYDLSCKTEAHQAPPALLEQIDKIGPERLSSAGVHCPSCGVLMVLASISDQPVPVCPKCGFVGDPVPRT